jgi:ADP-ribose pyrophosphatase
MAEDRPIAWLVVRRDELVDRDRSPRFLRLRSVTTALEGADGARTAEGTWDFVERPIGLDAVVVVVHRRGPRGVEVLLRSGPRVPCALGRPGQSRGPGRYPAPLLEELVAGLVEAGESHPDGLRARALAELREEAGLVIDPAALVPLGGPVWLSPGLCGEVNHFFAADATGAASVAIEGDGSPFEALCALGWYSLDEAIARVAGSEGPGDARAEIGLRRLRVRLDGGA